MTITLTILILLVAIALFVFGGMIFAMNGKKVSTGKNILQKLVSAVAVVLIAGATCQLWTPVYLVEINPLIVKDMAEKYEEHLMAERAKQEEARNKMISEKVTTDMDAIIGNAPIAGNEKAEKTIFLWSDYSCPYCRRVHAELSKVLKERKDVRLVLKNYSIHGPLSDAPAKAVIAAKIQSNAKAAKLDELLMAKEYYSPADMKDQSKLGEKIHANVMKLAKEAGLDTKKLAKDMEGDVVMNELVNVRRYAQEFGISGTPFLIINGQAFPGAIPYARIVDALGPVEAEAK